MEEKKYRAKLIDLLSEILKWTRFIGKQQLKALLLDSLKEDVEKVAYELSDGKSLREIERICKDNGYSVSRDTINRYWYKWVALGFVEPSKRFKGRYEKIVSLEEVGIECSKIELKKSVKGKTTTKNIN
jgi:hypothetical protein